MTRAAIIEASPGGIPGCRFASDDEMVCSRLKKALEGLNVSEIARQTGASRQSIHRYAAGFTPSVSFLVRFCEATEISAEWLLVGRGPKKRADVAAGHLASASATELCQALARRIDTPPQAEVAPRLRLVSDGA